jgi:hypothetical protein
VSEIRKVTPSGKAQWIRISRRNHYLDCEAMNEAAGHLLAAQKIPLGSRRGSMPDEPEPDMPHAPPGPAVVDPRKMMADFAAHLNSKPHL